MPRKPKKRTLQRKADTLFSQWVRREGFCERCGTRNKSLHCSHVIPRGNLTLRYHPYNALALCHVCHRFWWHANPLEATLWFKDKYVKRYQYLMKNKNKKTTLIIEDYQAIIKEYQARLKNAT